MPLFSITVRPYADKTKPNLKYVLRVRHPDGKVELQGGTQILST